MTTLRVAVVTGSRAEFGLLEPVMRAVSADGRLRLLTVAAGSHLLGPAESWRDIRAAGFEIDGWVEMQRLGEEGRWADARAAGRGVERMASLFEGLRPDWVVVLGDRVEAFAGAAAASIGGAAVAHIHAGDRAEGIADEAMRHACSKMSHLLLAATESSAARLIRMGERAEDVRVVGSPAVDGLEEAAAMSDARARELGDPCAAVLLHPSGQSEEEERALARAVVAAAEAACAPGGALLLAPNHDAGRSAIMEELGAASARLGWALVHHLPRGEFIGLLKRLAAGARGFLIGNSSAGLIEAAALRLPAVNVGARQAGRERPDNVIDAVSAGEIAGAVARALALDRARITHPYGDGRAGERIAGLLAAVDPHERVRLRKRCSY